MNTKQTVNLRNVMKVELYVDPKQSDLSPAAQVSFSDGRDGYILFNLSCVETANRIYVSALKAIENNDAYIEIDMG